MRARVQAIMLERITVEGLVDLLNRQIDPMGIAWWICCFVDWIEDATGHLSTVRQSPPL